MRHLTTISDFPDLPELAFRPALGKNRPATLEGGGSKAPSAPDPGMTAEAQYDWGTRAAAYNKALNLGNYQNPFGGQTSYISSYDPATGAPIYSTNVNVNPALMGSINNILGSLPNTAVQNAQNEAQLNNLLNQSTAYGWQTAAPTAQIAQQQQNLMGLAPSAQNYIAQQNQLYNTIGGLAPKYAALSGQLNQAQSLDAQKAGQNAAYAAQTQYLDPRFSQQQESLEAKLAAQGLSPGSQAYTNAMQQFNAQKQQAYSDAANQAVITGSQLGSQNLQNQLANVQAQAGLLGQQGNVYGQMGASNAQNMGFLGQLGDIYGNTANLATQQLGALQGANQMLGMQAGLLGQRQQMQQMPYAQLQSLAGFVPGMQGIGASNVSAPDYAGLLGNQYQAQLGQYNASQQSRNQMLSGLGTAAMFAISDRRIKRNIKRIGEWKDIPVYSFDYIFDGPRQIGVIAQEAPAHAISNACGVLMVNYSKL